MNLTTAPRHLIAACAFVALGAGAATASAQSCETDADCADGFACESYATLDCDEGELPPCPDGEDCPEPEPCEEVEFRECVYQPVACGSDSDCASGDICLSFTYEACPDDAPSEGDGREPDFDGEDRDPQPMPMPDDGADCETVTEAFCAPAWAGGCAVDADCGAGFSCVEIEECSCASSGGGDVPPTPGVPTPDPDGQDAGSDDDFGDDDFGDDEDPSWEEDCACTGIGEFYCEPQEIACAADADCPESWSCESFGSEVTCTFDAETGEEFCEEATESSYCFPPNWAAWAGVGSSSDDLGAPRTTSEEAAAGGAADNALDEAATRAENEEGCTAAGGASTGALWLLGLLGVARRRRR